MSNMRRLRTTINLKFKMNEIFSCEKIKIKVIDFSKHRKIHINFKFYILNFTLNIRFGG